MKLLIKYFLVTFFLMHLTSCDDDYPQHHIENVQRTLPAHFFDYKDGSDIEFDEPYIINSDWELDEVFNTLELEKPKELNNLTWIGQTFVFFIHNTKHKNIEVKHDLSYKIPSYGGSWSYEYIITEVETDKASDKEEIPYTYYSGVVIQSIFKSTYFDMIFKYE